MFLELMPHPVFYRREDDDIRQLWYVYNFVCYSYLVVDLMFVFERSASSATFSKEFVPRAYTADVTPDSQFAISTGSVFAGW